MNDNTSMINEQIARDNSILREENASLIAALKPFADFGSIFDKLDEYDDSIYTTIPDEERAINHVDSFTIGDLRRAYRLIGRKV